MEFEYKRYTLADGETISRPVIPILIRNARNNEAIEYEALIDSGADRCVLPASFPAGLSSTAVNARSKRSASWSIRS